MISILNKQMKKNKNERKLKLWVVIVWLIIWMLAAMLIGSKLLLPTPLDVCVALGKIIVSEKFFQTVILSFLKIFAGFGLSLIFGLVFAWISYREKLVRDFFELPLRVIKAIPVASFIILTLVFIPASNLSVFIAFLISFPIVYTNVLEGLNSTDDELLEMAAVYKLSSSRKLRYIYVPMTIPYFKSAVDTAIGYAWKAGVAAEIIGIARGSVGEKLYEAKIYLEIPELFAWTVVVIIVSSLTAKAVLWIADMIIKRLEGR